METFGPEELNARGRWLLEQKRERGGKTGASNYSNSIRAGRNKNEGEAPRGGRP